MKSTNKNLKVFKLLKLSSSWEVLRKIKESSVIKTFIIIERKMAEVTFLQDCCFSRRGHGLNFFFKPCVQITGSGNRWCIWKKKSSLQALRWDFFAICFLLAKWLEMKKCLVIQAKVLWWWRCKFNVVTTTGKVFRNPIKSVKNTWWITYKDCF